MIQDTPNGKMSVQDRVDPYAVEYDPNAISNQIDSWFQSYLKTMQNQFAQETQTGRRAFTRTAEDAATQAKQFTEDYTRFTWRDQELKTKQLAATSKEYASALSNAADAYWQRWILNSWIAIKNANKAIQNYWLQLEDVNTNFDQAQAERDIALKRQQNRYGIVKARNAEDLSTYWQQRENQWQEKKTDATVANEQYKSGVLWAYAWSVEALNTENQYRKSRWYAPAQVGIGKVNKYSFNPNK